MERLTKKCVDTENGKYLPYTVENYVGLFPNGTFGDIVQKLAYYEDLEEQGKLVVIEEDKDSPCNTCNAGSKICEDDCLVLKEHIKSVNGY